MEEKQNYNPRDTVKVTNPEYIYQIKYKNGQSTNIRKIIDAATNYNQVLNEIRQKQGDVTEKEKDIVIVAAEKLLEKYYLEHIKVIEDSQKKGATLKKILNKARVGTASALVNLLDDWSEKIKSIANLESSQRQLRIWNDTYRVQKDLVKKILKEENVSPEVIDKVNAIYKTRSVNKAVEKGCDIFDLEKSEILKIVKSAIRYSKLVQKD
ncbi:MAG: hypothetical protein AB4372_18180 [Xenococcus sp. (in: cyanobacteria)]